MLDNNIKYSNGVPVIHGLSDDMASSTNNTDNKAAETHHNSDMDISNAVANLDKEKKIKTIMVAIVALVIVFGSLLFVYFYYRDKANNPNNNQYNNTGNNSTSNITQSNPIQSNSNQSNFSLSTTTIDNTNTNTNIKKEKNIADIWPTAPKDFMDLVTNMNVYEDHIELEIINEGAKIIEDMLSNDSISKDIASSVFNINDLDKFSFVKMGNKKLYYGSNGDKAFVYSIFANENNKVLLVLSDGFNPILNYK